LFKTLSRQVVTTPLADRQPLGIQAPDTRGRVPPPRGAATAPGEAKTTVIISSASREPNRSTTSGSSSFRRRWWGCDLRETPGPTFVRRSSCWSRGSSLRRWRLSKAGLVPQKQWETMVAISSGRLETFLWKDCSRKVRKDKKGMSTKKVKQVQNENVMF